MNEERYLLKDALFNKTTVKFLADCIKSAYREFDDVTFYNEISTGLKPLELKERMSLIEVMLEKHLTTDYEANLIILKNALSFAQEDGQFIFGSFCEYVEKNGCNEKYLDVSLDALGEFTKSFSAEFAIRNFINTYPAETFEAMMKWSLSDNVHQRRLVSEGFRPKLPWAKGITYPYKDGAKPLDNLFFDDERYVTRSVANHLNDISKIDAAFVIETLQSWKLSDKQNEKEMDYIINHSTRTLVKKGNLSALELLGYKANPKIIVIDFSVLTPNINLGEALEFFFTIQCNENVKLMIDYIINYPMANNKRSTKVFKITKSNAKHGEKIHIAKKHFFKLMTTKKLYTGHYSVSLQINGQVYDEGEFFINVN